MGQFNKTTAAILAGAVVTIIAAYFPLTPAVIGAAQTILTALAVFLIPNVESKP